jgi:hypothetical protein
VNPSEPVHDECTCKPKSSAVLKRNATRAATWERLLTAPGAIPAMATYIDVEEAWRHAMSVQNAEWRGYHHRCHPADCVMMDNPNVAAAMEQTYKELLDHLHHAFCQRFDVTRHYFKRLHNHVFHQRSWEAPKAGAVFTINDRTALAAWLATA